MCLLTANRNELGEGDNWSKQRLQMSLFSEDDVSVTQWLRSMTLSFILLRKRA